MAIAKAMVKWLLPLALLAGSSSVWAQVTADLDVKLVPVMERVGVVTDINVIDNSIYVCTQPGLLLRKSLSSSSTTDFSVFLDLRAQVGSLGFGIPALPGLGYPNAGTYDERGLLGFAADPAFRSNGRFWVWYSNINDRSASPPDFFQWLVSTTAPWDMSQYDHVDYLAEYRVIRGAPVFQRTVLKVKRPYFNHTGFQSLVWSPEHDTLVLGLGDGGSEYDPNNLAQDDLQLSGKLLKIDLAELGGRDFTHQPPLATFADLRGQAVPEGAITPLVKGLRNPSKVSFEAADDGGKGGSRHEGRYIKYLANTGQDTIEFIHGFVEYGINFGFRPWEGIFPTSFEVDDTRVIAYGLEASRLPNFYHPLVEYTHLDPDLAPNANTGSTLYKGNGIAGLKGQLVFTDWISFAPTPKQGRLMHAAPDRSNLQEVQPTKLFNVDLSAAGLTSTQPVMFYTSINTDAAGDRIFVGGFKDIQFITNMRQNALGTPGLAGGVYEVVRR